jgi:aspartate oxidase
MSRISHTEFDVVVIGKGIAGLTAAMEATASGARVAVIYDSPICSTSLAYEGVFRSFSSQTELEQKIREYSAGLTKSALLRNFSRSCGLPLQDELQEIFPLVGAPPVGRKHKLGGPGIVADLEARCLSSGVAFLNGKVARICASGGAVSAVQSFVFPRLLTIKCKSIILAAGGGIGNIYDSSDNTVSYCSPGAILALNAGARLRDLEFISFHPFGAIDRRTFHNTIPIFTFYNIGVRTMIYGAGTHKRMELVEDLISTRSEAKNAHDEIYLIAREVWKAGGAYFYERNDHSLPATRLKVVSHSLIGGIDTDPNYETRVRGLYAVGESAGGLNGAGRMPGMALLEGFVSAKTAARSACEYCNRHGRTEIDGAEALPHSVRFGMFTDLIGKARLIADRSIFIERDESELELAAQNLENLISSIPRKTLAQRVERDIAEFILLIARASLMRKESRGFFSRRDHPEQQPSMQKSILITKATADSDAELSWE